MGFLRDIKDRKDVTKAAPGMIASAQQMGAQAQEEAVDGWNARIRSNPTVAQRFNQLYTGR